MPQLIAMIIVVVAAMIYMFQTFGGTGDKIEGIAQKTSVITEINNIKNGLKLAARAQHIGDGTDDPADATATLQGLATLAYFAEQMNQQMTDNTTATNVYNAISFGGTATTLGGMRMQLVVVQGRSPGIYVDFDADNTSNLRGNAAFLESQVATDLASIAHIDRNALSATAGAVAWSATPTDIEARMPGQTAVSDGSAADGKFIIYFNDFAANEVVR